MVGNDTSDFFPFKPCKLINVFPYLAENDVHYYLCNYFACDPWNYPSNNTFIATVSLEPLVLGVRPCLQQFCILLFPEWTPDIVTCGTECRFFISEFKKKTQQNALLGEKTVSRMEVIS